MTGNEEIHDLIATHMANIELLQSKLPRLKPEDAERAHRTIDNLQGQVANLRGLLHLMEGA